MSGTYHQSNPDKVYISRNNFSRFSRISRIEDVWNELKDCYRSLSIKCLAFREGDEWLNIKVVGFLSKENEDQLRARVMQEYLQLRDIGVTRIDKLLVAFDVYDANRFLDFVEQLSSGIVTICGECIRLGENMKIEMLIIHTYISEKRIVFLKSVQHQ
jgi:hypothetical protein